MTSKSVQSNYTTEEKWFIKWTKGALKSILRAHQYQLYDAIWACLNDKNPTHTSHVNNSSRQIGKSFTQVLISFEFAIRFPGTTILFVAPQKSQAEEIIYGKTYFTILENCPQHLKPKLDGNTICFPNGSRIRLGGTENRRYEDLRGGAADLLILDEAGFMSHLDDGVIPALQPMLTTTKGKTIFSSTPPPSLEHPYTAIYRDHLERGHVSTFTIFDNTSLTEDDLIKQYTDTGCKKQPDGTWAYSTRFKREFLAEHVMEGSILVARDWDDRFCVEGTPNEYHRYWHRYVSMDPGVTDFNATLFGYYDFIERHLYVEDELVIHGRDVVTPLLVQSMQDKMFALWQDKKPYRMVADNNNPHLIQDLMGIHKLPFYGTNKTVLETRKRSSQEEGMTNKLNTWLRTERISVHPRCTQLLGCLRYATWTETGENTRIFSRSKQYGHYDALAALIYLVRNVDEHTNPIPPTYGVTANHHVPESVYRPSHNVDLKTLGDALRPKR